MSDTHIRFSRGHEEPMTATCGCEIHGAAVLLCPLHASASDLLAACEVLLEDWLRLTSTTFTEHTAEVYDTANTAISKAKGE